MYRLHRRESAWSSQRSNVVSPPVLLRSGNNLTHERLLWARLKSPFVIIHAADLRLRGRHHRSVFGFSAASNKLFFFLIGPLVWAEYALTQQSAQFTFPAELPASSAICTHTYCCTCLHITHACTYCGRGFEFFLLCLCWVINNSALLIKLFTKSLLLWYTM